MFLRQRMPPLSEGHVLCSHTLHGIPACTQLPGWGTGTSDQFWVRVLVTCGTLFFMAYLPWALDSLLAGTLQLGPSCAPEKF